VSSAIIAARLGFASKKQGIPSPAALFHHRDVTREVGDDVLHFPRAVERDWVATFSFSTFRLKPSCAVGSQRSLFAAMDTRRRAREGKKKSAAIKQYWWMPAFRTSGFW
jgi:hypothetical protein